MHKQKILDTEKINAHTKNFQVQKILHAQNFEVRKFYTYENFHAFKLKRIEILTHETSTQIFTPEKNIYALNTKHSFEST